MPVEQLSRVRKSILPQKGDDWSRIAHRELPDLSEKDGVSSLQSWNLHVFMRAAARMGTGSNDILPSDVIFIEPPLAQG